MISKELLENIDLIDKNLKNKFSSLNQTDLEMILSRACKLSEEV
jgi:hypothetical protein